MSNKRSLKEDIALLENLVQDQLILIEARLRELEQSNDSKESAGRTKATLTELFDISTLIKALLGNVKDNYDSQSAKWMIE
jgi:hypothetical protein